MTSDCAHRNFHTFQKYLEESQEEASDESSNLLLKYIRENIIGINSCFQSPFGSRRIVYCDYIASGRSLKFIEQYILEEVLPLYGSTHTTTSVTSLQTSLFRHEARNIIRNVTQASEHDRVLFVGSGATSAIHKLLHGLLISKPLIVFIDPFAHHSSLLPFRERDALLIRIKEDKMGGIDMVDLENNLKKYHSLDVQRIGCFTVGSNISGHLLDDFAITKLLHLYDTLAFWDYAAAAPYIDIQMNPLRNDDPQGLAHKDALFFSLHKFVGGVQTPGVLIAKKHLFKNNVPSESGGGTVFFVSREGHRYLKDIEEREEGGTPPIVETIRGGLVMQLKSNLSRSFLQKKCQYLNRRLIDLVECVPELVPLGDLKYEPRLPILSFNVRHIKSGKFLHYNFISAILNDLYGIQTRGGCACAGPYAQDLLGLDEPLAQQYEAVLLEDTNIDRDHLRRKEEHNYLEVLRPGFVRLNLSLHASEEEISFILTALKHVCEKAWYLLPQYIFTPETGEWKHHSDRVFKERQWIQRISYKGGMFSSQVKSYPSSTPNYEECLKESVCVIEEAPKVSQRMNLTDQSVFFANMASDLRWFLLPHEVKQMLEHPNSASSTVQFIPPFFPPKYPLSDEFLSKRPVFIWNKLPSSSSVETMSSQNILDIIESLSIKQNNNKIVSDSTNSNETLQNDCNSCPGEEGSLKKEINGTTTASIIKWVPPPKDIFNPTLEAINEFKMIQDGDKVLVCLSGGKDSLSLLHTLHQYQYYARATGISFTLGAVTVDPQSSAYDPRPLIPYLATLKVPYYFEIQGILKQAMEQEALNSICSFCSRMKRGRLYAAARREGFNVLAFGQHLDDLAESFLMSIFHNGRLRTMKASYAVKEKDLRVIRPFVFVREKDLRKFAETKKLPIIPENCPGCFEEPKERHRVKQLLAHQEILFPRLFYSLRRAMHPLFSIAKTGIEDRTFGKRAALSCSQEDSDSHED